MWLLDPKTGKQSVSITLLVLGSIVALVKFAAGSCSGSDVATVVGAFAALYATRKYTDKA